MQEFTIKLSTIEQIRSFVSKIERLSFAVDLKEGRYVVDAKSIMGIFSLDLLKPIKLTAYTDDLLFKEEIKEFLL
ncbi:MAG: HPr family phosphocarrier protein [Clostridia bacterium]